MKPIHQRKKSESGFIIADFLFSFTLVIGVGMFIFALTFSLATIEISQYIVWSAAHTYSSANVDEAKAATAARVKFKSLSSQFPLLTGEGNASPWFTLDDFKVQNHATEPTFMGKVSVNDLENRDGNTEKRQPWTGASAYINLKLFGNMGIPFIGKVGKDPDSFKFRIYAFIIRHPSFEECSGFFEQRFEKGVKKLEGFDSIPLKPATEPYKVEDNGC